MKISWSGQHTRTKALPILIRAMSVIKNELKINIDEWRIDVLGCGSQTKRWWRLARQLGVGDCFIWHGWLKRDAAQKIVLSTDIFVITSLKDLTSTVTLEALSMGKPVICLDHCGFADVVNDTCGIKIPIGTPSNVIAGFARAIVRMRDASFRKCLSVGALTRAAEYRWDEKVKLLEAIYGGGGKKVLMSAYACSPYHGSEPGMGWKFVECASRRNEVWVIVEQEKWKTEILAYLKDHPNEMVNVHWEFIHKPRARHLRKIWPPSYYWFYRIWQWRAYKKAIDLHKELKFDIVHQVNMVGFRECGFLWRLAATKFVWGPFGGLGYTDLRLLPLAGFWGAVELLARNIINCFHAHFLSRPRKAARRAAADGALIAATAENQLMAKSIWGVESSVICEIGVNS